MALEQIQVGPQVASDGATVIARGGKSGEQIMQNLHGIYYEQAYRKNVFIATGTFPSSGVSAFSNTTFVGLLLWNGPTNVNVVLLGVHFAVTTAATTAAVAIGVTGANGQPLAPTGTTPITSRGSGFIGANASQSTPYIAGTVAVAGSFFFPIYSLQLGATSTIPGSPAFADVGGAFICPPNSWIGIAGSAATTALVAQISVLYEEVPV